MSKDSMKTSEDAFEILPEYDFSHGIRGRFNHPKKVSTSIRLDDDVILFFKKKATEEKIGYQTLMNMALREYINRQVRQG